MPVPGSPAQRAESPTQGPSNGGVVTAACQDSRLGPGWKPYMLLPRPIWPGSHLKRCLLTSTTQGAAPQDPCTPPSRGRPWQAFSHRPGEPARLRQGASFPGLSLLISKMETMPHWSIGGGGIQSSRNTLRRDRGLHAELSPAPSRGQLQPP